MLVLWWLVCMAIAGVPLEDALVRVADKARPAVVHVEVVKGPSWTPALQELLRAHGLELPEAAEAVARATGSAVIVSRDGRLLTNQHVIDAAVEVRVVLPDQRVFPATVVGSDPRTDVAVLQIEGEGPFPFIQIERRPVKVGQVVVAVGSPFDFQSTVTTGIVSAKGRRGLERGEIQDFIQTDAAVNPGNSGGPLLDLNGRVIGINTAIYSQGADQNSGVSFAIPADMALSVVEALEATGDVPRPSLGVEVRDVEEVEGDASRRGAEVARVVPSSPASAAGLRRGDVIVSVDDEPIPSADDLRSLVLARSVGRKVVLGVVRAEVELTVEVELADRRDVGIGAVDVPEGAESWLGMDLVDDGSELRGSLGVAEGEGPLVARVTRGGVAASLGIMAGDRVTRIGGVPVLDLEAFRKRRDRLSPGAVVVTLTRSGDEMLAVLPIPASEAEDGGELDLEP